MTNRRDHYDQDGHYTGYSEDSYLSHQYDLEEGQSVGGYFYGRRDSGNSARVAQKARQDARDKADKPKVKASLVISSILFAITFLIGLGYPDSWIIYVILVPTFLNILLGIGFLWKTRKL